MNPSSHELAVVGHKPTLPTESIGQHGLSLDTLSIVSFNIAGCDPSKEAPADWTEEIACEHMRDTVLEGNPDLIALQECPGESEWATRLFSNYQVLGVSRSHMNRVILLVRNGITATPVPLPPSLPAVMADLQYKDRHLRVVSMHLAPFQQGSEKRKLQVEELLLHAESVPLIMAGDTNMRDTEDAIMEDSLGLLDVWKMAGSESMTRFTWDTMDHTAEEGGTFNRYYGSTTREYQARYDRIYVHTSEAPMNLRVESFGLVANQPVSHVQSNQNGGGETYNNKYHFLSDHFGMTAALKLEWNE